jgi:hypothetical protein
MSEIRLLAQHSYYGTDSSDDPRRCASIIPRNPRFNMFEIVCRVFGDADIHSERPKIARSCLLLANFLSSACLIA